MVVEGEEGRRGGARGGGWNAREGRVEESEGEYINEGCGYGLDS